MIDVQAKTVGGVEGIQIDYHNTMVWKSSPFLKGLITTFATSEADKVINFTVNLMATIFKTNQSIPPGASGTQDVAEGSVGPFEMKNLFK